MTPGIAGFDEERVPAVFHLRTERNSTFSNLSRESRYPAGYPSHLAGTGGLRRHFLEQGTEFRSPEPDQRTFALKSGLTLVADRVDLGADPVVVRSRNLRDLDLHSDRLGAVVTAPEHIGEFVGILVEGDRGDAIAAMGRVAVIGKDLLRRGDDRGGGGVGDRD